MSDIYLELLDATIHYLQERKAHGDQWLPMQTDVLARLSAPAPRVISKPAPRSASIEMSSTLNAVLQPIVASVPRTATPAPAPEAVAVTMPPTESPASIAELRERALSCQKCLHLAGSRKNVVFGVGDEHASLMFVGEAPGADEDVQGEPFVGAAGQLLTRIIKTMGFSRETVYIANVLKCRPDTPGQAYGNRKPTPDEMRTCLPYLLEQIRLIQPKVIVALGATAMEGLFGKPVPISKVRGHWQTLGETPVMPTFHPSYLLRNQSPAVKREVWEDMLQVMEKLEAPISEKQRNYFR